MRPSEEDQLQLELDGGLKWFIAVSCRLEIGGGGHDTRLPLPPPSSFTTLFSHIGAGPGGGSGPVSFGLKNRFQGK